jgi:hypothetical protein
MEICKENEFMSFDAKVDFLGQRLAFGQRLTFSNFFNECKRSKFLYGQN